MMEKRNVPRLRFLEFDGEWEPTTLEKTIKNLSSGVSVNSEDIPAHGENFGILKTSSVSKGSFHPDENKSIIEEDIYRAKVNPKKDAILISRMNTPKLVGESGYIEKDYPNLFVPDRLWMVEINSNHSAKLISFLLSSSQMMDSISNICTGTSGSMKNISKGNFLNLLITLPKKEEQLKIAEVLNSIKNKLQSLKKKKVLLEKYKKGMMQKIFDQEIRFKDENGKNFGEWETIQLRSIAKFFSGGTPLTSKPEFYDGDIPFIKSGEINKSKTEQFISEAGLKSSSANMVEKGDLLFALYGATSGEVGISQINGAINQAVLCIRYGGDVRYLHHYLLLQKKSILSTYLQGGQGNLSADIIKSLSVPLPTVKEQTKIANFLSAIDDKINLVAMQIEKIEKFKKGLLGEMFV
jgi:type I restriction enzyme S subunit